MLHVKSIEGFHLLPETKVIKARDYAGYAYAQQLIELAKKEAQRILLEATKTAEEERRQGYQQGLWDGQAKAAELTLESVTKAIDYFGSVEEGVVDVVNKALRRIIGEFDDKDLIVRVVRNALEVERNQKQVTVRVAPADADAVRGRVNELLAQFSTITFVDVTADPRLKPGSAILESEMGVIDASIEVQLAALQKALVKTFKHVPST